MSKTCAVKIFQIQSMSPYENRVTNNNNNNNEIGHSVLPDEKLNFDLF